MPAIASTRLSGKTDMNESDDMYMLLLLLSIHLGKHDTDCASADPMKHASTMVAKILI